MSDAPPQSWDDESRHEADLREPEQDHAPDDGVVHDARHEEADAHDAFSEAQPDQAHGDGGHHFGVDGFDGPTDAPHDVPGVSDEPPHLERHADSVPQAEPHRDPDADALREASPVGLAEDQAPPTEGVPEPEAPTVAAEHDPTRAAYDAVEHALGASLFDFGDQPQEAAEGIASGYVPMEAKTGALQYQPSIAVRFGRLPSKVDLRPLMAPVEDSGGAVSSVAAAVASAYEYWIARTSKQERELSPLFVDYNARWRDGAQDQGGGSAIQLAVEALSNFGTCSAGLWPTDMRLVTKRPGAEAYKGAAPPKVTDAAQVPLRLQAWKQALAEGKPIIFGIALFDAFDVCSETGGVVPMPAPDDVSRSGYVLHAMCAVGYCENERVFIVRNPRGVAHWGDNGYCYMPYAYIMNPKLNDGDCWVFVPKASMPPSRETWSDDTKPVTNGGSGVDFPIEAHRVEDYADVAVDLFEPERRPYNSLVGDDYARYAHLAGKGSWNEMESFDANAFLSETSAEDDARYDL